ncbi:hypothetical protein PVNG_02490 [Plasmodium vivax North Korean]|uniref:Uncharacterized protein n=1 Tax=Plasmodium vivax North Korean TaxID=1035514 RepID=A0A0J9TMJ2_PLAVI|nr:hypothetical protein PVNG_02490 [Plasmodium vivax North Korean]
MSVDGSSLGDIILMRPDGRPTYNFAAVVDDYEMKISDIFRGEEHLANTPYQIALYEAFGWEEEMPKFGHLSVILSEKATKISKRDPDSCRYQVGYFLKKENRYEELKDENQKRYFATVFRSRVKAAYSLNHLAEEFFNDNYLDEKILGEIREFASALDIVKSFKKQFEKDFQEGSFDEPSIRMFLKIFTSNSLIPRKTLLPFLRLCLSGNPEGVPVYSMIYLLGKNRIERRVKALISRLEER